MLAVKYIGKTKKNYFLNWCVKRLLIILLGYSYSVGYKPLKIDKSLQTEIYAYVGVYIYKMKICEIEIQ